MSADLPTPRWFEHRDLAGREEYAQRFMRISERGEDIDGEARFVDAMAARESTILDAGCGTGRVAAALLLAGHDAYGIDVDPLLIEAGREFYPSLPLAVLDLLATSPEALAEHRFPTSYDLIVCPGNVLQFVAEGTQAQVVQNLAGLLKPQGRLVVGFHTGREYSFTELDEHAERAGLTAQHRFATWELHPFAAESDFAVSVFGRAGQAN